MDAPALRLGTVGAVIEGERLLLTRRADLNVWTLPGGRLDSGETLEAAVVREVREETGLETTIIESVGLYYMAGFQRMNVLYLLQAVGGGLRARTAEARSNRFFPRHELPPMWMRVQAEDALGLAHAGNRPPPRVIRSSALAQGWLKVRLGMRYLGNALRHTPEPRFAHFDVRAIAVVWDERGRLLTRRTASVNGVEMLTLPRLRAEGVLSPWAELTQALAENAGVRVELAWVGLWQDAPTQRVRLVFTGVAREMPAGGDFAWTPPRNAGLLDDDARYVALCKPGAAQERVWTLYPSLGAQPGDILSR